MSKKKNHKKSRIESLIGENRSWFKKNLVYVKKNKVRSWKALFLILFFLGGFAAVYLSVYYKIQTKSKAASGTAKLTWNLNTDADLAGYKIYYGTGARTGSCPQGGYATSVDAGKVSTYTISNLTEGQTYYFSITAYDTSRNESCFSQEVSKFIPLPVDITVPTASISSPSNGTTVSASINFNATASDNVGVTKVEFLVDNAVKSTDTTSPYSYSLNTTGLSNGSHSLLVKAYDAANNIGSSSVVTINVQNTVACTSFTYSDWGVCSSGGAQTRTVTSSSPSGCTGGNPVTTQSCTPSPVTCTSFTYSDWGVCSSDGTQIRTVASSSPSGCTGGNPVTTQSCTPSGGGEDPVVVCTNFKYSKWSSCNNGERTRTVLGSSPAGCTGGNPILSRSCR